MDPCGPDYAEFANSCIPSVVPPGMDPSLVDFREFYPYIPNEVKHRKRTTQAQLEILEETFSRDKKPNANLRTTLARELDMTPRGVQVWFQNRRAKEKTLAKKASLVAKRRSQDNVNPNLNYDSSASPEGPQDRSPSLDQSPPSHARDDSAHTKPSPAPILTSISPSHQSERSESAPASAVPSIHCDHPTNSHPPIPNFHCDSSLNSLRRGSLPIIMRSTSNDAHRSHRLVPNYDLLARRSSFDTNIYRLAAHPYAHIAALANEAALSGPRNCVASKSISISGGPGEQLYAQHPGRYGDRLTPTHRASMPYLFAHGGQQLDPTFVDGSQSQVFSSRYHDGMYAMPSRVVQVPVAGPLPTPGFSFGSSTSSPSAQSPSTSESSEHIPTTLNSYSFPNLATDPDTEDDHTNSSFDAFSSRFGSIASLTGSDSSLTSAFYSETGSCVSDHHEFPPDFNPDSRRPSHASGQMLDHFSTLDLETQTSPASYAVQDNIRPNRSPDSGSNSPSTSTTYPSPGSTVSSGSNPQNHSRDGHVRISLSSELALALSPAAVAEGTMKQEVPEAVVEKSVIHDMDRLRRNDSSPTLDPSNLLSDGRACYDPAYSHHGYSTYDDETNFQILSKQGHYVVPSYSEGHSSNDLGPSTSSGSSVSSLYPQRQALLR
jgi:hypothetical protein